MNDSRKDILLFIQDQLMISAALLAAAGNSSGKTEPGLNPECDIRLEKEIDKMEKSLPKLKNFILPGGNIYVSYCHIARCVCRRAERSVLRLNKTEKTPEIINKFLNRLSDYLFVLSRLMSLELDNEEIKWPL